MVKIPKIRDGEPQIQTNNGFENKKTDGLDSTAWRE